MEKFELQGKAALVTGGNGGIGLGMAQGLTAAGAKVAIAGRDGDKNAAALKALGAGAGGLGGGVGAERARRAVGGGGGSRPGRPGILVEKAGLKIPPQPPDHTLGEWER